MLLTWSICKLEQESHNIGNVGSNTISGIPKATNDVGILYLSNNISSVLEEFHLDHKVCLQVYS